MDSFKFQLLHAADLEAGISSLEDAPRFSAIVNGLESEFPDQTLLISSGDNYIPGPFLFAGGDPSLVDVLGNPSAGRADIALMNAIGFDASALGNHEFDLGTNFIATLLAADGDYPGTQFPYLSANIDVSTDSNLAPFVVPDGQPPQSNSIAKSVVFELEGEFVGVVGATTPLLDTISSPGDVTIIPPDPEDFDALAAEIQTAVDELTAQGVNKIILTAHLQQLSVELAIAERLRDVDIIIAGGSDTILADETDRLREGDEVQGPYPILRQSASGEPIAIVSTDGNYTYVGRLVVEFDSNGILIPDSIDPLISGAYATDEQGVIDLRDLVANPDAVVADSQVVDIVTSVGAVLTEKDGNIFGRTEVFLNGQREDVRTQETNLGNLSAEANLATAREIDDAVVISIKNGGGIRASIGAIGSEEGDRVPPPANELTGKQAGEISQLDIENALRFNNELSLLTLTAEQLVAVLEHGVAATAPGATPGRFPQVAGLSFSFDPNLEAGSRVRSLVVETADTPTIVVQDGELVVDPEQTFRVVTLNFLADGGDGYPFDEFIAQNSELANRVDLIALDIDAGNATFTDPGTEQDALAEYLLANFSEEPYDVADVGPGQDSRIQNLNERSDTVITPLIGASDAISLAPIGTYETGIFDESAAEIVQYDPKTQRLFVVNANQATVDVLDISDPTNIQALDSISSTAFGGIANSVAIFDGVIAVAVENENTQLPGKAVFFDVDGNFLSSVEVGALPDMITFTPDGSKVLVANEGEPNDDYTIDPEGSVSIIDVSGGFENLTQDNVTTADFRAYNDRRDELIAAGVRIFGPNATVAQDLEPEYIQVSADSTTAWIALQENNALAVLDIASGEVTDILPLGFKDHSLPGNGLDVSDRDGAINIANWPIKGMYQPDGFATYEVDGETYIVTANEGDARDYDGYSEEARIKDLVLDPVAFPNAAELQADEALGRLTVTTANGDTDGDGDFDELYVFGGRSFAIWDTQGNLVYESQDDFEKIIAETYPQFFNSNHRENSFDTRSDDKGPEPEDVAIGEINGRFYAFIGLERVGGIMTYDITDPTAPQFVQYINNRDFSGDPAQGTAGDLGTEGIIFISAEDSPNGKPLVVTANEVSGTTTVFEITVKGDGTPEPTGELIFGTEGDDELFANTRDTVFAGAGNDIIDAATGGGGNQLYGGDGDDELFAGSNDRLFGEAGNDILNAAVGSGKNRLYGGEGNDTLIGGTGDRLFAGSGDDVLFAGQGDNLLNGGAGADQFWIAYNGLPNSVNAIADFQVGIDIIGIGGLSKVNNFSDLTLTQNGADTLINVSNTDLAILRGIQATSLNANSFEFA
jgi:2',3'-cyclic-nucleotide 2'-phosphodiesterase/3'-nucleotidase/5'-nucleotidase